MAYPRQCVEGLHMIWRPSNIWGTGSPEKGRFLDSSGTSEVFPSLYLAKSTETRYNNQSQETGNFHEFLYYYASAESQDRLVECRMFLE